MHTHRTTQASEHSPCGKLNYFLKSPEVAACYAKLAIHADVPRLVALWRGYDSRRSQVIAKVS